MKLGPKIRGRKIKSIRVDPSDLALLRKELKENPEWEQYGLASESELVRIAVIFARLHIQPDVFMLTSAAVQTLVDEAIRLNIAEVARALGGAAQLNADMTITVAQPERETITFNAKPPTPPRPTVLH